MSQLIMLLDPSFQEIRSHVSAMYFGTYASDDLGKAQFHEFT